MTDLSKTLNGVTNDLLDTSAKGLEYPQVSEDSFSKDDHLGYFGWHIGDTIDSYLNEPTTINKDLTVSYIANCMKSNSSYKQSMRKHIGDYIDQIHSIVIDKSPIDDQTTQNIQQITDSIVAQCIGIKLPKFIRRKKRSSSSSSSSSTPPPPSSSSSPTPPSPSSASSTPPPSPHSSTVKPPSTPHPSSSSSSHSSSSSSHFPSSSSSSSFSDESSVSFSDLKPIKTLPTGPSSSSPLPLTHSPAGPSSSSSHLKVSPRPFLTSPAYSFDDYALNFQEPDVTKDTFTKNTVDGFFKFQISFGTKFNLLIQSSAVRDKSLWEEKYNDFVHVMQYQFPQGAKNPVINLGSLFRWKSASYNVELMVTNKSHVYISPSTKSITYSSVRNFQGKLPKDSFKLGTVYDSYVGKSKVPMQSKSWVHLSFHPTKKRGVFEIFEIRIITILIDKVQSYVMTSKPVSPRSAISAVKIGIKRPFKFICYDPHQCILPIPESADYSQKIDAAELRDAAPTMFRMSVTSQAPESWTYIDTNAAGGYKYGMVKLRGQDLYSAHFEYAEDASKQRGWAILFNPKRDTTTITFDFTYQPTHHHFQGKRIISRAFLDRSGQQKHGTIIEAVSDEDVRHFLVVFTLIPVNADLYTIRYMDVQWLVDEAHHTDVMGIFTQKASPIGSKYQPLNLNPSTSSQTLPMIEYSPAMNKQGIELPLISLKSSKSSTKEGVAAVEQYRSGIVIGMHTSSNVIWVMDSFNYDILTFDYSNESVQSNRQLFRRIESGTLVNFTRNPNVSTMDITVLDIVFPLVKRQIPIADKLGMPVIYIAKPRTGRVVAKRPRTSLKRNVFDLVWVMDETKHLYYNTKDIGGLFDDLLVGSYVEFTHFQRSDGLRVLVDITKKTGDTSIDFPVATIRKFETPTVRSFDDRQLEGFTNYYNFFDRQTMKTLYASRLLDIRQPYNAFKFSKGNAQRLSDQMKLVFLYYPIQWKDPKEQDMLRTYSNLLLKTDPVGSRLVQMQTTEGSTYYESIVLASRHLMTKLNGLPVAFLGPETDIFKLTYETVVKTLQPGAVINSDTSLLINFAGDPDSFSSKKDMAYFSKNLVTPDGLRYYLDYLISIGLAALARKQSSPDAPAFALVVNEYNRDVLLSFMRVFRALCAIQGIKFPHIKIIMLTSIPLLSRKYPGSTNFQKLTINNDLSVQTKYAGLLTMQITPEYLVLPDSTVLYTTQRKFFNTVSKGFAMTPNLWYNIPKTVHRMSAGGIISSIWHDDLLFLDMITIEKVVQDVEDRLKDSTMKPSTISPLCQLAIRDKKVQKK